MWLAPLRRDFGQVISPHVKTDSSSSRHPGHPCGPESGQGENKERGVYAFKAVILLHGVHLPANPRQVLGQQLPWCVDWKV